MTRAALLALLPLLSIGLEPACAQTICISDYLHSTQGVSLGFAPSDVEKLVAEVSVVIGLSPVGIKVIPCPGVREGQIRAQSVSFVGKAGIPDGDYILYDPVWVREIIGPNLGSAQHTRSTDEAIVLFGHELGHLLGRHFTVNAGLTMLQKETAADRFAGCAAGALDVSWDNVEDILGRLRGDADTTYPSRDHSLAVAKDGYRSCLRVQPPPPIAYGEIVGGAGGLTFEEGCRPNEALVGLYGRNGQNNDVRLFSVGPVCSPLRSDPLHNSEFSPSSVQRDGVSNGSYEGAEKFRLICPLGTAVSGYHFDAAAFSSGNTYLVDHLTLDCSQPVKNNIVAGQVASIIGPREQPIPSAGRRSFSCPDGTVATGVKGRAGEWIDALGLFCRSLDYLKPSGSTLK